MNIKYLSCSKSELWYDECNKSNFTVSLPHPYNKIGDGPEGVEIKLFAKRLNDRFAKHQMKSITIVRGPYLTSDKEKYKHFREQVENFQPHAIKSVRSKGKWLYFNLGALSSLGTSDIRPSVRDTSDLGPKYVALGVHHGMEGSWCDSSSNKHVILKLEMIPMVEGKQKTKKIYFQDSRRFGTFTLLTQDELDKELNKLGPDIFKMTSQEFNKSLEVKRIQKHRLCETLLDQRVISGIGNYIRADVMYLAKLDPRTEIKDLNDMDKQRLYNAIRKVSRASYKAGATTIGYYESSIHGNHHDLDDHHRDLDHGDGYKFLVYQKDVGPDGENIQTFKDKNGRTVHYVP